jgi:hypothetical protein
MPTVRLSYYECWHNRFPRACAVCAGRTEHGVLFVIPSPSLVLTFAILSWLCPPAYVLAAVVAARTRKMRIPMCPRHQADWRRWDRAVTRTYLVVVLGGYVAAGLLLVFLPADWVDSVLGVSRPAGEVKWLLVPLAYCFVALTWFVPTALRQTRHVRITQATARDIRLSGVHAEFAKAVREDRASDPDPARMGRFGDARDDYDDER